VRDEAVAPGVEEDAFVGFARVAGFDHEHGAEGHDAEDGEEGWGGEFFGAVVLDGAGEVVGAVVGFGGEGPWGFVAAADVYAAEEDGVESVKGERRVGC
jgi:hypothetical protein